MFPLEDLFCSLFKKSEECGLETEMSCNCLLTVQSIKKFASQLKKKEKKKELMENIDS